MQWDLDQQKPPEERQWLHWEVDEDGKQPLAILCTPEQRKWGRQLPGEPGQMDVTHGLQRYGLKLLSFLCRDVEGRGTIVTTCKACQHLACAVFQNALHWCITHARRPQHVAIVIQPCHTDGVR